VNDNLSGLQIMFSSHDVVKIQDSKPQLEPQLEKVSFQHFWGEQETLA
jgi:hypothetical protein